MASKKIVLTKELPKNFAKFDINKFPFYEKSGGGMFDINPNATFITFGDNMPLRHFLKRLAGKKVIITIEVEQDEGGAEVDGDQKGMFSFM